MTARQINLRFSSMNNQDISKIFREIAVMLELKGANRFRIRAYERAAQNLESLTEPLEVMVKQDLLTSIAGIGKDLSLKIKELFATGKLKYYQDLKEDIPQGLFEMLKIQGLGPKTVRLIYDRLGITTIAGLAKAASSGQLRLLEGIRERTEKNILRGIEFLSKSSGRHPLYLASQVASEVVAAIAAMKEVKKIELAGSLRRCKETIGDIDILVSAKKPELVIEWFISLGLVGQVLSQGKRKSSIVAKDSGIQVDLRVISASSFGSGLLYFTGSKGFNISLRKLALKKGYSLNEYGVFSLKAKTKNKSLAGENEQEIFTLLGLDYIPPEMREDRGELELALSRALPNLVKLGDLKGDLHVHSIYSDGSASIAELASEARRLKYEYIGISDHSQILKIANGLSEDELERKINEIKKINRKLKGLRILCGSEVDILKDGRLDYSDRILKKLDFVIAAVHSNFKQSKSEMTKRLISACKNKHVNIIAHPTGVLAGMREPYEVDLDQVFEAAADHRVALEINCHPQRSDLSDLNAMRAKKAGAKIFLGTDSHDTEHLSFIKFGLAIARRSWLEKEDIINCLSLAKLLKWLKK